MPAIGHFSEEETRDSGVVLTIGKHDLAAEKSTFDIATAFNYGQGSGSAQLLRWITEHTEMVHSPPYEDWRCTMTIGSTSALDMALRILARPGDTMLYEEFTFSAAIETATPMGIAPAAVPMDDEGLLPDEMDALLSNWDEAARGRKPHLLYTIPTGQNPTGATQSAARRRALYAVCRKHDIFILENVEGSITELRLNFNDDQHRHFNHRLNLNLDLPTNSAQHQNIKQNKHTHQPSFFTSVYWNLVHVLSALARACQANTTMERNQPAAAASLLGKSLLRF